MQLVITAKGVASNDPFIEDLKTYKYRDEVKVLLDLPEPAIARVTAGAYAFVYPASYDGMALFVLRAMQCEIPVVTSSAGAIPERAGSSALYADPGNFEDIAEKMMMVFRDESGRAELIESGRIIMEKNKQVKLNDLWMVNDEY